MLVGHRKWVSLVPCLIVQGSMPRGTQHDARKDRVRIA